MITRTIQL